jgi:hypothetical protein
LWRGLTQAHFQGAGKIAEEIEELRMDERE